MGFYYTVEPGDCLSSLARQFGLYSWRTIYDAPENSGLRKLRPNPNILFPGDEVFIPASQEKTVDGETQKRHKFVAKKPRTMIRLLISDVMQRPLAGKKFTLVVESSRVEDTIPGNGIVEVEIDPQARTGLLIIHPEIASKDDPPWVRQLELGHLDPVSTMTGIQARLNNVGFNSGKVDGILGPITRSAVKAFQKRYGLKVDGIPGPKTQAELRRVHGC
ncbi:MAG: peptidoglycan-binding protein [Acidobacteriota bacterium]